MSDEKKFKARPKGRQAPFVPRLVIPIDTPDERGIFMQLEENYSTLSVSKLLDKFYHHSANGPITTHLESERGDRDQGYYFVYRWNFYIFVERHWQSNLGPHIAKLRYVSQQTKRHHWIATLQIMCHFFNEHTLSLSVSTAIEQKQFFATPKELQVQVTL